MHNPTGLDVTVWSYGKLVLGVEIKQKPVTEASVHHLAEEAWSDRDQQRGLRRSFAAATATRS